MVSPASSYLRLSPYLWSPLKERVWSRKTHFRPPSTTQIGCSRQTSERSSPWRRRYASRPCSLQLELEIVKTDRGVFSSCLPSLAVGPWVDGREKSRFCPLQGCRPCRENATSVNPQLPSQPLHCPTVIFIPMIVCTYFPWASILAWRHLRTKGTKFPDVGTSLQVLITMQW